MGCDAPPMHGRGLWGEIVANIAVMTAESAHPEAMERLVIPTRAGGGRSDPCDEEEACRREDAGLVSGIKGGLVPPLSTLVEHTRWVPPWLGTSPLPVGRMPVA